MEKLFDLIAVAYRSRLLFRSEAGFRNALGVSFETVANNRESARDMEMYFGILARVAEDLTDSSLEDIIRSYVEASEFYASLDWGDRSQLASRRKFCRMLFRLYATAGKSLSNDEIFKFNIKNDDDRLLKEFFPDGTAGTPRVDVLLIVLFSFGVLRPFTENSRGRDIRDRETTESLEKLRALIEMLREDMPRIGLTEKPFAFEEWLDIINSYIAGDESLEECTTLWMWSTLMSITHACHSVVIAERLRMESDRLCALNMYGIWIDDADGGKNRFWIFPENCQLAFCYEYDGMTWRLGSFEFKVRFADKPDYNDTFLLIAPDGNLNFILSPDKPVDPELISIGLIDGELDEATGEITSLTFREGARRFPDWFKWRKWERLSHDDARYLTFHSQLIDIYNPKSPRSMFFENRTPEVIDRYNNLAGRDKKYLYVYDWQPKRCVIREWEEDLFIYQVAPGDELPPDALFQLKISARNPLYAIPLEIEPKNYGCMELDRLVEVLKDADNIREVYVVYSDRLSHPRLAFPMYSLTIAIDMDILVKMGVLKFTQTPFR